MAAKIKLGTRGSELALTQARMAEAALRDKCGVEVEIRVIRTTGDERSGVSGAAGYKGLFTAELQQALAERTIDVAVHSAKDLPSEMYNGVAIAAVLPRGPAEDLFLTKRPAQISSLQHSATIATGSIRRQRQLRWVRPDFNSVILRGNVPSRLHKFAQSGWDGLILARAGLERLGFSPPNFQFEGHEFFADVLPAEIFVPAGGQGVIALQTRSETSGIFSAVDDIETRDCLRAEREFLRLMHGDCDLPVGVYARFVEGAIELRAQFFGEAIAPRMASARGNDPAVIAAEAFRRIVQEADQ